MLYQIFSLLLNVTVSLVAGTCLLRLYMQFQRVSLSLQSGNPFAPFIFAFTNWCVLPLRRFIPSLGRLDTASLVAAYLVVLAKLCVMTLLSQVEPNWQALAVLSMLELVHVEHGVAGHCLCAFVLGTDGIRSWIFLRTFGRAFVTAIAKRIAANWWDRPVALGAFGFIANYGNSHYPFNGNAAFVRVSLTDL